MTSGYPAPAIQARTDLRLLHPQGLSNLFGTESWNLAVHTGSSRLAWAHATRCEPRSVTHFMVMNWTRPQRRWRQGLVSLSHWTRASSSVGPFWLNRSQKESTNALSPSK